MSDRAYVYILTNRHCNVMYVGITTEPEQRIMQHRNKQFGGFTARYNIDKLVHIEAYPTVLEAIAREKQIKGWRRSKKNALVTAANPEWKELTFAWWSQPSSP